jgi:ATP-dependent Lon protease
MKSNCKFLFIFIAFIFLFGCAPSVQTSIDTLELSQYGSKQNQALEIKAEKRQETNSVLEETAIELQEGQKIIRDNQIGISYDLLFGAYLIGATDIKVVDPYVRLPFQLRNFMELAKLIAEKKDPDVEVKLHLATSNNEEYIENAKEAFQQMSYSLESLGIIFTYEFDDYIHDRSIVMDNGWKIVMGRGLDIWQKTGGWYDINEYIQEQRLCKANEITFIKN